MTPRIINRITLIILLFGFGSSVTIFLLAKPEVVDPFLGDFRSSKRYQHDLKVMGGQANVLVDEFREWFGNRWHGRELARTIAVLTAGSVLLFRTLAAHPDYTEKPEEENPDEASSPRTEA